MKHISFLFLKVQESDLPVFDKKVQGIQKKAFEAAEEFLLTYHGDISDPLAGPQLSAPGTGLRDSATNGHNKGCSIVWIFLFLSYN